MWWKLLLITLGCMAFGFIPLMGLPGAVFMGFASPLAKLLFKYDLADLKDGAWPMAILVTWLWPPIIMPAWYTVFRWVPLFQTWEAWHRWLLFAAIILVWGTGVALTLFGLVATGKMK
jgi:hypothetical protein